MQPPASYPIAMLPALTGRTLARCLAIVEAGLVRRMEVPFGDKAKDDGGRRKAILVPAGRVRSIMHVPDAEIPHEGDEDEADRIARLATLEAGEVVRARRTVDSAFSAFEVEVPVFAAIFPVERETLLMAFARVRAPGGIGRRLADDEIIGEDEIEATAQAVALEARAVVARMRETLEAVGADYARRFTEETRDLGDPAAFLKAATQADLERFVFAAQTTGEDEVRVTCDRWFDRIAASVRSYRRQSRRRASFAEASGYDRYPSLFPLARAIGRRLLFLAGPTNSGKTYEAMRLAIEAPTAEVLSPLRLLAHEHRETLSAGGVRAGLVTGEERDTGEDVTHYARTIETIDVGRRVDVAVIDEIQMLADEQRGWAWTQALFGVPADLVVMTGSPDAVPMVERLAKVLGEPLEVRVLARKNELAAWPQPITLRDLRRGDAVVAFSRAAVHELREAIVPLGLSVATVYGALSPEVRRAEAARFRRGEADVVVATDAIGMGLNLPVSRVFFSALDKFDGTRRRALLHSEIRQIGGRAGRFGMFEEGFVGVIGGGAYGVEKIRAALSSPPKELTGRAFVRPNRESVALAAEFLETDALDQILAYLRSRLVLDHPDLKIGDMDEEIEKARRLSGIGLPLLDRLAYAVVPVSLRHPWFMDTVLTWARAHAAGKPAPLPPLRSGDLQRLEDGVNLATAWLWLSQRFPEVYRGEDVVREGVAGLNAQIERNLTKLSSGLAAKSQPTRDKARRGRKPRRPDAARAGR
ncbi:helicase-related protein [uncultured Aureimonas sp.]|uniref:helicase-related protein n=1 Tax=uncultured Aureimonas sp. TaxID=1604662 RepID=UPI0025E06AE7|nr:helicase-related protein [uncultured Aureimonas sp.]